MRKCTKKRPHTPKLTRLSMYEMRFFGASVRLPIIIIVGGALAANAAASLLFIIADGLGAFVFRHSRENLRGTRRKSARDEVN